MIGFLPLLMLMLHDKIYYQKVVVYADSKLTYFINENMYLCVKDVCNTVKHTYYIVQ